MASEHCSRQHCQAGSIDAYVAIQLYLKSSAHVSGSLQGYLAGAFFDYRKAFSVFIKAPLLSQLSLSSLASVVRTFNK